ncbi:PREDICTED: UDP-glycosyltransferase 72E1 [Theobroma cacao]|uniref:Glycosyltransferase n=1 Tax=Theobroma cacao TaxID=3641 RepID=A0AB32VMQ2_THECC|nr:PREDICTED: UDP-glycosyltransferase 72E1 [Theobroma cacao]
MQTTKPHVALLASPGLGHLIPVLELGKRLVTHHNFRITIFVLASEASTAQNQLLESSNMDVLNIVSLPSAEISTKVDPGAHIVTKIVVIMRESLPGLRSAMAAMKSRPSALIVDLFGTEALPVADEFKMLKYVFIASNAWFLGITVYAPTVEKIVDEEHVKQQKPLKIPGCKSVRFEDTLEAYLNRNDQLYGEYARVGLEIPEADGILVNTFEDLEPATLRSLTDAELLGRVAKVPVYPIGPVVRTLGPLVLADPVLDWLDKQPSQSVIYVSFGSGGTLSAKQMTEIAWGLEQSQQRFIWVVRPPVENDASGTFFTVGNDSDGTPDYLPDGFLTRTRDRGLVLPMWAPQTDILAHPSVGGFVSHCGWNSTMESLLNGVPLIAWPLYAEQKMNATMLTEELGLAVRPKMSTSSRIVERKELEMVVRKIMVDKDGQEIRDRAKELKHIAQKALSKGGSSCTSLSQVAKEIEMSLKAKVQGA